MEKISLTYLLTTKANPKIFATEIAYEQSVEIPAELISEAKILKNIVGRIVSITPPIAKNQYQVIIEYPLAIINDSLNQLLNLMYGNISLKKGIKCIDLTLPESFMKRIHGPKYGVAGIREKLGVYDRPLSCAALKPLGKSPQELANICRQFALGGIDIIKDDHNLGDQIFCPFQDRLKLCKEAIDKGQEKTGRKILYFANITGSLEDMYKQIDFAARMNIDGLLFQPMIVGLDFLYSLVKNKNYSFFLMAHPALSGAFFNSPCEGIAPEVLLGTLFRLAGAEAVVFPNFTGRFSFDEDACRKIAQNLSTSELTIQPSFPTPAGGINMRTLPEIKKKYQSDTIYLIGADLYKSKGSLQERVKEFLDLLL